jgi:hypothetical protein
MLKPASKRKIKRPSEPEYRRSKKLYTKLEKMEIKLAEIHDYKKEIKLKIYSSLFSYQCFFTKDK